MMRRGKRADATALAAYRQLQEKYTSILAGREPRVLHHRFARGSMGWARVQVGAESRTSVENARTFVPPARAVG
jgi:hypothetical protein